MLSRFRKKPPAEGEAPLEAPAPKKAKKKSSLDLSKAQQFFLLHIEKLLLGAVAFVVLWSLWGVVRKPVFQQRPEDLEQLVQQANSQLSSSQFTENHPDWKGLQPVPIVDAAVATTKPVVVGPRELKEPFDPPVIPVDSRRDLPRVFAVQELQATSDYGAFNIAAAGWPKGYRWVVVTGLIPYAEQQAEYTRCLGLSSVRDKNDDVPTYSAFLVERAEIITGADDEPLKWERVPTAKKRRMTVRAMREEVWAGDSPDVIDAVLTLGAVTDPLPPLLGRSWSAGVAHPRLPIPVVETTPAEDAAPAEEEPAQPDDPFGNEADGQTAEDAANEPDAGDDNLPPEEEAAAGNVKPAAVPAAPARGRGREMAEDLRRRFARAAAMAAAAPAAPAPVGAPAAAGGGGGPGNVPQEQLRYRLFRFFDFTVEEGKRYRYRVRLALDNPNYGMDTKLLKEPAVATVKDKSLVTDASAPSQPVTAVRANNLLAGPAKAGRGGLNEPVANVLVRQFHLRDGVNMVAEKEILRGQVADFRNEAAELHRPGDEERQQGTVNFRTGMMLLDILGGESLKMPGRTTTYPAVLAFLDPDGRITVASELTDATAYEEGQPGAAGNRQAAAAGGGAADAGPNAAANGNAEEEPAGGRGGGAGSLRNRLLQRFQKAKDLIDQPGGSPPK